MTKIIVDCKVWQTALQTSIGGRIFYCKMALLADAFLAHERRVAAENLNDLSYMRAKDADG